MSDRGIKSNPQALLSVSLAIVLLWVSLPALAASHYTIMEVRDQAAIGWHQSYKAYGREIMVDVDAEVPDVSAAPILKCFFPAFTPSFPGDDPLYVDMRQPWTMDDLGYFSVLHGENQSGATGWAIVDGQQITAKPYHIYYEGFEPDGVYPPGNDITFAEIAATLTQALANIGLDPDIIDPYRPESMNTHAYYGQTKSKFLSSGWGALQYNIRLRGIPALGALADAYPADGGVYGHIGFSLRSTAFYNFGGWLFEESGALADDVPLAGFEPAIRAFEKEIEAGRLCQVFALRYVRCPRLQLQNGSEQPKPTLLRHAGLDGGLPVDGEHQEEDRAHRTG